MCMIENTQLSEETRIIMERRLDRRVKMIQRIFYFSGAIDRTDQFNILDQAEE